MRIVLRFTMIFFYFFRVQTNFRSEIVCSNYENRLSKTTISIAEFFLLFISDVNDCLSLVFCESSRFVKMLMRNNRTQSSQTKIVLNNKIKNLSVMFSLSVGAADFGLENLRTTGVDNTIYTRDYYSCVVSARK